MRDEDGREDQRKTRTILVQPESTADSAISTYINIRLSPLEDDRNIPYQTSLHTLRGMNSERQTIPMYRKVGRRVMQNEGE